MVNITIVQHLQYLFYLKQIINEKLRWHARSKIDTGLEPEFDEEEVLLNIYLFISRSFFAFNFVLVHLLWFDSLINIHIHYFYQFPFHSFSLFHICIKDAHTYTHAYIYICVKTCKDPEIFIFL